MKSSRSPETTLQEREAVPAPWTPLTCSCAPGAWHPGQGTGVAWLLSGTGGGGGGGQGRRGTGPPHHGACIRLSLPAPAPASSAVTSLHGHEITAHEGTHLGHESPGQRCQRPVQQAHETEPPHPEAAAWPGGARTKRGPRDRSLPPPLAPCQSPCRPWAPGCCQPWRLELCPSHCVGQTCFSFF